MLNTQTELDFIKHKYGVEIIQENDSESPREYDNVGYFLVKPGNKYIKDEAREIFPELEDFEFSTIQEDSEKLAKLGFSFFPVSIFDHSGVSILPGEYSGWDCGVIGFYVSKNKEEFLNCAENEIKVLNAYWQGDTFGVRIIDKEGENKGEIVDECWGYIFTDETEEEIYKSLELESYNISMEEFLKAWGKRYEN